VNRFTEHSQVVTTNNYSSLNGLHTPKITVNKAHKIKSSISAFTSSCWVTGLNNGYSFTMFSLTVSWKRILTEEL
jgi:hypothetical protein